MKLGIVSLTLALVASCVSYGAFGEVLSSWPSPKYPNTIAVNGIAFEGEYIWIKSIDAEENAVLKCTKNGSLVTEIGFPQHGWGDSYGLAYDGEYLWTILHQPFGPMVYDHYDKYTTTGSYVNGFQAHLYFVFSQSNSVSWDGQYLWTDGRPQSQPVRAEKYTTAGTLVASYSMPQNWRTAAGYYNDQIWAGAGNYVYGMNIGGAVVGSFAAPGGSCKAVTFDGEYLWTADANKPQYIYKVDIDVVGMNPESMGKIKGLYR